MNEFYEDDEPVDEVVAAFERGQKGVTRRSGVRNVEAPDFVTTGGNLGSPTAVRPKLHSEARARLEFVAAS